MSTKKKAFSGSTMTLKDFHGGSIPSDLPLPSAPGVVVRPSSSDHRQIPNAWTNNSSGNNRSDLHLHHRSRPGSSGSINHRSSNNNNYDEKGSIFSHSSHIGRNFDEDERKPLDGVSLPKRTVSDETSSSIRVVLPTMTKPDSPTGRFNGRSGVTTSVSQQQMVGGSGSGNGGGAYPGRFSGSAPVLSGGSGQSSSTPNAWGMRKEAASVVEPVNHSNWSGPNAVSRFAQASALEKVSSGRWQTKPPVIHQPDVEVIRFSDDSDFRSAKDNYLYNEVDLMNEKADFDIMRGRYEEKSQIVEDEISGAGGKGYLYQERARSPMYSEAKERSLPFHRDVVRPTSTDGKLGGSFTQPPMPTEVVERPKIKLLPRSKPFDNSEILIVDYTQGHQPPSHSTPVETINEGYGNEILSKPGSASSEGGDKRVVERPRLNLKPRSQPLEQADAIAERERKALFGDARPRELVLKERGVDDVVINNLDVVQPPNRPPKTETKPETVNATPVYVNRAEKFVHVDRAEKSVHVDRAEKFVHVDRAEKFVHDQKSGKHFDRKDHRTDFDKNEQRGSWRNENWRNSRETEKQQQQERRPEPETWRKPVEEPNSPPSDAAGLRYGKAASALELAQAFSRSNSGPKTVERLSGQRGLPGRSQIPFSRLTETREFYSGSNPRRQINGY